MSDEGIRKDISTWNMIGRFLKHLFLHNGWLKLFAVLLSIALWAGLISQDASLTRDKVFSGVPVSVTGTDTMKRNGFIVVDDLSELLGDITVTAAVPQKQYENADVSAYSVRVDLSKIKTTGEQEIRLQSNPSSLYGKVTAISPSSIILHAEEYITRSRIPVSVNTAGNAPDGWFISSPTIDPSLVAVSGPRSIVNTVSRAKVMLDMQDIEWQEGICLTLAEIKLYNRSGEEINNPLIEITQGNDLIDSVLLEQLIMPSMTFDITDMITYSGTPARGYELKSLRISPEMITVAAPSDVLEQMTELPLSDRNINIKNLKETTSFQLKIAKPSEDTVLSNETVTVTAEIGPIEE